MSYPILGIIGGSGLYEIDGLHDVEQHHVDTPFGPPSDAVVRGVLGETTLLFIPRHGRGHIHAPHRINYRANMFALKRLGAEQVVSISAVGSLQEGLRPGDFVLVDQYIDRTRSRPYSMFDEHGVVAHVGLAHPVDEALSEALAQAAGELQLTVHRGGTYVCIEGPQFSTLAESELFRSWGAHVVGMTNLPEARLARECELPYASVAMVTDYDCWHEDEDTVSVEAVVAVLKKNVANARALLARLAARVPDARTSPASSALAGAILTAPERISPEARKALAPLLEKYLA